jgi:hypothetical protein
MQMLCNVVVEMNRERRIPSHRKVNPDMPGGGTMDDDYRPVSVFDFTEVLERTERRVRDDLLGAGPSTVDELRSIAGRLGLKYQQQLEQKERRGGAAAVPQYVSVTQSQVHPTLLDQRSRVHLTLLARPWQVHPTWQVRPWQVHRIWRWACSKKSKAPN